MTRALLFARVSKGEDAQDPESQLGPLRAAADRHGWTVADELVLGISAWKPSEATRVRQEALAPIQQGEADVLCVWAIDRLVRGGVQATFSLLHELEEHLGAHLFSLQEPFLSTATMDPHTRDIMVSLRAWMAEQESQRRSQRLKAKANRKRVLAAQLGQRATWGPGRLATPSECERVHSLKDEEGKSFREIGQILGISKSQAHRIYTKGLRQDDILEGVEA